jgi:hypothetical protein
MIFVIIETFFVYSCTDCIKNPIYCTSVIQVCTEHELYVMLRFFSIYQRRARIIYLHIKEVSSCLIILARSVLHRIYWCSLIPESFFFRSGAQIFDEVDDLSD